MRAVQPKMPAAPETLCEIWGGGSLGYLAILRTTQFALFIVDQYYHGCVINVAALLHGYSATIQRFQELFRF